MLSNINTDRLLVMAMESLGGESHMVSPTRWLNHKWKHICFPSYSTRLPFDNPSRICASDNKLTSRLLLQQFNVPVIPWILAKSGVDIETLDSSTNRWVIKPISGKKGQNIYADVSWQEVVSLLQKPSQSYHFVEPYIEGDVFRILLLQGELLGIYKKLPPIVYGDGESQIKELLIKYFKNNLAMNFNYIRDFEVLARLKKSRLSMTSVLQKGASHQLTAAVNIARAARWSDVQLRELGSDVSRMCKDIYKALKLELIGIDIIQGGDGGIYVLEANPSPGLIGHSISLKDCNTLTIDLRVTQKVLIAVLKYLGVQGAEIVLAYDKLEINTDEN